MFFVKFQPASSDLEQTRLIQVDTVDKLNDSLWTSDNLSKSFKLETFINSSFDIGYSIHFMPLIRVQVVFI